MFMSHPLAALTPKLPETPGDRSPCRAPGICFLLHMVRLLMAYGRLLAALSPLWSQLLLGSGGILRTLLALKIEDQAPNPPGLPFVICLALSNLWLTV